MFMVEGIAASSYHFKERGRHLPTRKRGHYMERVETDEASRTAYSILPPPKTNYSLSIQISVLMLQGRHTWI